MKKPHAHHPAEKLPPGVAEALRLLWESRELARVFGKDVWDFAVGFPTLHDDVALTEIELRSMTCAGHVEHAVEIIQAKSPKRMFRQISQFAITARTCVILTEAGAAVVKEAGLAKDADFMRRYGAFMKGTHPIPSLIPHWDKGLRQLRLGDHIVKQFTRKATWQELILDSFEEEHWAPFIDDPLHKQAGQDPVEHLHSVIVRLNERQHLPGIRFYLDGTGRICWQLRFSGR